jgi:hypothetical protein
MRPWFLILCILPICLSPTELFASDPPAPIDTGVAWPPPNLPPAQPPLAADPLRAVGPQLIDVELLLGLPTEVRLQGAVWRGSNLAFMLEGIVGAEVVPFVFGAIGVGFGGVGGRLRLAPCNGERNAFVIKPGLDVYDWFDGAGGRAVGGADVELLGYHTLGNRFGIQEGLDLGVFFGANGAGSWWAWPMVSFIVGLHF